MSDNVAIYGITGALGREVLAALEVDHEGIGELVPVAGPQSAGLTIRWRGATVPVLGASEVDPTQVDVAIFATRADVVAREAGRVLHAGGRVIDASGALARNTATPAPLVWPRLATPSAVDLEVAPAVSLPSGISSTLAPILEAITTATTRAGMAPLVSCDVVVLVAASGAGKRGIDALSKQAVGLLNYQSIVDGRPFPQVLAFNVVSDVPTATLVLEERVQAEVAALLPDCAVRPSVTPLWVPAFSGLVAVLTLRFVNDDRAPQSLLQTLTAALRAHPDIMLGEADDDDVGADDVEADEGDSPDEDDEDDGEEPTPAPPVDPEVLALRDALDQDEVRVGPPALTIDGAVRLIAFADPLRRTAVAAQQLVARFLAELDADA